MREVTRRAARPRRRNCACRPRTRYRQWRWPRSRRREGSCLVTEPYTVAANAIRGVPGGALPWEIDAGRADLRAGGRLQVKVEGLVLARRAPFPEPAGTNPITQFKAVVSCLTITAGPATTSNVETPLVPASSAGDAKIDAMVALPSPCFAPIIFVTAPTGAWFAVTGR